MQEKNYFVYIAVNNHNNVMYVGVTNNLERRMYEHKNGITRGFTHRYNISKLVFFEQTADIVSAIAREKEIKKWRRVKKNLLVESCNKNWKDLYSDKIN